MTTPTQSEKRIAIAKATGWTIRYGFEGKEIWVTPDDTLAGRVELGTLAGPGDYENDLNACHEADNALSDEDHELFRMHLRDSIITDPNIHMHHEVDRAYVSAPASLRAEALFQTLCNPKTP